MYTKKNIKYKFVLRFAKWKFQSEGGFRGTRKLRSTRQKSDRRSSQTCLFLFTLPNDDQKRIVTRPFGWLTRFNLFYPTGRSSSSTRIFLFFSSIHSRRTQWVSCLSFFHCSLLSLLQSSSLDFFSRSSLLHRNPPRFTPRIRKKKTGNGCEDKTSNRSPL